jgi:hypothetical protein
MNRMCQRCGNAIEPGEEKERGAQVLCEDCFLEVLTPPKACDPWAVHLAKSEKDKVSFKLTSTQQQLYELVREKGEISFPEAAKALELTEEEVRREFATLRHLELLRAKKSHQEILITLF